MGEEQYSINTGVVRKFGTVDYVLFVCTLVVSAGIGVFYAIQDRRRNTTKEFLLGGKKMNIFPVAMSLMVTFQSALTLLGNPAEIYNFNTMFCWLVVGFTGAIIGSAYIFIPFFYNLGVTSTFEYLEMRFSKPVRIITSLFLLSQLLLYMSFLLYAPSLALNAGKYLTGVDLWGCVIGIGIVVTFYTTLGGMKAVLWTDTFQAGVIFAGLLAVVIKGSLIQGGFVNAWEIANNRSRVLLDDFSFDPKTRHSVWSMVIGGTVFWLYLYGLNQAQVQRCLSCPSAKKAQQALLVNLPGLILINIICFMIGIVMFAFYADCHPITYGVISKTDQLVPLYAMDILGHLDGMVGIFVSCVVSGSLSSLSSSLNAISAIIFRDYIQGMNLCQNISELRSTITSKLVVAVAGAIGIGCAWIVSQLGNILQAVYVVFGILNGPVLGVFTLGMFFPWANKWGALSGLLTSLIFLLWVGMGAYVNDIKTPASSTIATGCNWTARPTPPPPTVATTLINMTTTAAESSVESSVGALEPLYRMSYMWYTGLGMIIVWGVGMAISACTGFVKPTSLDPRLVLPIFDKLFPYLPERILKPLRFGVIHEGKYDLPPAKSSQSINISMHTESQDSVTMETTLEDKQPDDVILSNGYVKPSFALDDKDAGTERANGHDNKAFKSDNSENGSVNVRF
ncbi:hypothetical protein BaRGS_00024118 [Batillaria attramentaria]|uniref:Sodium-coupled monocarboxylate transporter 2 n=1 Tax=Batillaria attramentaria TaxID=370345 RepID=A0ABD0KC92_9CAEN